MVRSRLRLVIRWAAAPVAWFGDAQKANMRKSAASQRSGRSSPEVVRDVVRKAGGVGGGKRIGQVNPGRDANPRPFRAGADGGEITVVAHLDDAVGTACWRPSSRKSYL